MPPSSSWNSLSAARATVMICGTAFRSGQIDVRSILLAVSVIVCICVTVRIYVSFREDRAICLIYDNPKRFDMFYRISLCPGLRTYRNKRTELYIKRYRALSFSKYRVIGKLVYYAGHW
jgi:hypothetical protein